MTVPLLLLPGMMCDARLFGPQVAALSAQRSVMLPTLAGHAEMTTLAAEVLAHAPPRFALLGAEQPAARKPDADEGER